MGGRFAGDSPAHELLHEMGGGGSWVGWCDGVAVTQVRPVCEPSRNGSPVAIAAPAAPVARTL